ncbi:putative guanine deaminase [Yarrowia sp. B02]|nr:putative guanine deaminase [Yarrowia sp. B02]
MTAANTTVFFGAVVNPVDKALEYLPQAAIGVKDGEIVFFDKKAESAAASAASHGFKDYDTVDISKSTSFFFPGFVDTHIHAPQYPNSGIFGKTTLLDWLTTYTFPLESSLKDPKIAQDVYSRVVKKTLAHGTTTAAYYATVHVDATKKLADICLSQGQRALVGRVCMDQNTPDYYRDASVEEAKKSDQAVVEYIQSLNKPDHILPIITPRFAPSCTSEIMSWQGEYAQKNNLHIQTHISENSGEIAWVKELFPSAKSYADTYHQHGLLTEKTLLAHAIHLSDDELALVKQQQCGLSHCPISNSSLTSGEFPARKILDRKIPFGLGTDVSGGYAPSILSTARHGLLVSRHVAMKSENDADKLSVDEVLYLATLGGAEALKLDDKIGSFEVGKKFDAQQIDLETSGSPVDVFEWELPLAEGVKLENLVHKWLFNGDDRNTTSVWVNGDKVVTK